MSDKKRTTVTTIETREVWIVRRVLPVTEVEALMPEVIKEPATHSHRVDVTAEASNQLKKLTNRRR